MPIEVTQSNFETEVLKAQGTVLVDFWADWCGPCRMLSPVIDKLAEKHPEVKVCKINVDDNQALAVKYGVSSIPNVVAFKNGEVAGRSVGLVPSEKLEALL